MDNERYPNITPEKLIELNNKGYSYIQIADLFGIYDEKTVRRKFKQFGIKKVKAKIKAYNSIARNDHRNNYSYKRKLPNGASTVYKIGERG